MELFKYNPTPYVNTQVDLPLNFLQGQLEVKQKEFDSQTMAVDKAAENFLKINPGMLTAEAYERVKSQYLPQIENIRDTLHQTGNIAMAAPALSKFTMNLAADPEVKNIMEDYKLTQAHNQAMQEGRYTKLMLPGLYNKEGKQRAQVGPGQTVQSSWYAPYEHVDPVEALRPEIKDLNARIDEGSFSWYNPATNETITDRTKLKILKPQIIAGYVRDRKNAFLASPESKGYVIGATDWGGRAYTDQDWERDAVQPLSKFDVYEQETERTTKPGPAIQAPSNSNKTDGAGNNVTPTQAKTYAFTTAGQALVPQVSSYLNPEVTIKMQDELQDEIDQTTHQLIPLATSVYQMTGVNTQGRDVNSIIQDSGLRQQARDNWNAKYVKNAEGHYVPKVTYDANGNPLPLAPNVTFQQEQAFEQWNNLVTSIDSAKGFRDHVKKIAGVDDYNPAIIKKAREEVNGSSDILSRSNDDFAEMLAIEKKQNLYDRSTTPTQKLKIAEEVLKQNPNSSKAKYYVNTYSTPEMAAELEEDFRTGMMNELKDNSKEGKIYRVWDELNNRMEQMQLVHFDNDKNTESILGHLVEDIKSGTISAKDFISDKKLDQGKLDKEFTANIPINKTTGLPDYTQISLSMAFDRKDGLVGIISMGGRKYEIDISKNSGSNLDKLLIEAHPELKEPTKFFHQVYQSLNQTSGTRGKFNLGANSFVFDHKSENLGKGAPKFEYEYDFDGTGKKRTGNLYEIYSAAAGVNNKIVQGNNLKSALTAQEITNEYTRMVNAAGSDRNKIQAASDWYYQKQDEALKEQLAREKASVGQTMGKGTQFRQTPKTPLQ
jgi:hypothetical protein